jgi:tRNA G18 (ribose-2'-O)-methylase SpoU
MQTYCPYPDCQTEYETAAEPPDRFETCPNCQRRGTLRSLEAWRQLAEWEEKRLGLGVLKAPRKQPQKQLHKRFSAVILEDVRSLWNVGSIFRSADASGIPKLYLCGITGCPPRKEIAKTSLGAEEEVAWEYHRHALNFIPALKNAGLKIVGLERCTGSRPLTECFQDLSADPNCVLIVGNEVKGISPETLSYCDFIGHLPMKGVKESLNVAVAFGIAAYLVDELK